MALILTANNVLCQKWQYPIVGKKIVTDEYYGKKVIDEYRNLEDVNNPEIKNWVSQEQAFYTSKIDKISGKDSIVNAVRAYNKIQKFGVTKFKIVNGLIFYKKVFPDNIKELIREDVDGKNRTTLFSTASLSRSTATNYNIDYFEPSPDGKYVAMGISSNGNEMSTIYTLNLSSKAIRPDSITRCPYGSPNWLSDGSGFFYNQLNDLPRNGDDIGMYENSVVKLHLVNTNPKNDRVIFSKLNRNLSLDDIDFPFLMTIPASDKVAVVVYHGSNNYVSIYVTPITKLLADPATANWNLICQPKDKVTSYVANADDFFLLNFKDNPKGTIEKVSLSDFSKRRMIFDATDFILQEIVQSHETLYSRYLRNGINGLQETNFKTLATTDVPLPFKGSVTFDLEGVGFQQSKFVLIGLDSWTQEYGIYRLAGKECKLTDILPQNVETGKITLESEEVLVKSHDGVFIPLSIIYKKGLNLNENNPTILSAYGAYGTTITPIYDYSKLAWFDNGGIYAVAHVRGGGENGDEWYLGGFKATKRNSWLDFISCAEYLIKNKYTSSGKLSVFGESAGAITVGRAVIEKPQLFKAGVIKVGMLNAVRMENSSNTLGVSEFGTIKDSIEFQDLYSMDVYHHVSQNIEYPALLLTASLNDARVEPWEAFKVAAKMQEANAKNIVLLRISDQGHFGDSDRAREIGEIYAFLLWQLGDNNFVQKK